ncbi:hypothetical protein VSU19_09065 [Verrucomicrobiales bacterium BCK34]|nr:hypothetical protein [Verrucomicrobiales bacterium BCK34]
MKLQKYQLKQSQPDRVFERKLAFMSGWEFFDLHLSLKLLSGPGVLFPE